MTRKKQKILCFSGWGQKFDSLEPAFDDKKFANFEISSFDYSKFGGFDDFMANISKKALPDQLKYDFMVGWSLGGQICLQLIQKAL